LIDGALNVGKRKVLVRSLGSDDIRTHVRGFGVTS
jgi:hypothetical protein